MKTYKILIPLLLSVCLAGCIAGEVEIVVQETVVETKAPEALEAPEATQAPATNPPVKKAEPIKIPQEVKPTEEPKKEQMCELFVTCNEASGNLDLLPLEKQQILPENGILFPKQSVVIKEGDSVFDVLFRELKANNIHLEFTKTPIYDSAYIEGIGNLYEFDMGDYSGWLYKVNGEKLSYGCSEYKVADGDKIEFYYCINFLEDKK